MIQFNATLTNLFQQPNIELFFLVQINTYKTTDYFKDLNVGGNTYLADGKLIATDPPQMSTTVDREIYKIALADPQFLFGPELDNTLVGKKAIIRMGFVNPTTKQPYVEIENTLLVYEGIIEAPAFEVVTENIGESKLLISCSSPLGNLDAIKVLTTTKDALKYIDASDTSFDQVYEGSGAQIIKWGKV